MTTPARSFHAASVAVALGALMSGASPALAEWGFQRNVSEVQVHPDRVRLNVGVTYGTCGANEGWWGWSTSDPRHKDWLAIALVALSAQKPLVIVDAHGSCSGPGGDTVGLERLHLKASP